MTRTATEQFASVTARDTAWALLERAVNLSAVDLPQWRKEAAALLELIEVGKLGRHHKTLDAQTRLAALLKVTQGAGIRVLRARYAKSQEPGGVPVSPQWDTDTIAILGILGRR